MSFTRTVEDFTCDKCGTSVQGTGYTNHCPECLHSKHVDVSPGDRAASCLGLMPPIRIEGTTPSYIIIQKCARCGIERRIRPAEHDNPDALVALAGKHSVV